MDGPERTLTLEPVTSPMAATASPSSSPGSAVGVGVATVPVTRTYEEEM